MTHEDSPMHEFFANLIVAVHLAYVSYVVFGLLVILVGMALKWQWIRNPWFRITHVTMILIVAFEAVVEFECPLTTWERNLRKAPWRPVLEYVDKAKALAVLDSPMVPGPYLAAANLLARSSFNLKDPVPENPQTFVGQLLAWVMFPDLPAEVLTAMYYLFALVVVLTFVLAPPRLRKKTPPPETAAVPEKGNMASGAAAK